MGQTAVDITGGTTRARVSDFIEIQSGSIVAVTAFPLVAGTNPAGTWVEIGLLSDGVELQHRIAILDAGYVGSAAPVGWTGRIQAAPMMSVYADVYSSEGAVIRLSLLVES